MKGLYLFISLFLFLLPLSVHAAIQPSFAYCEDQGYTWIVEGEYPKGEIGYCVFDDGNKCGDWAFLRGECGQEYVREFACKKKGECVAISETKCCGNLKDILPEIPEGNECVPRFDICDGSRFCSDCGNKICDNLENKCNCPEDCNKQPEIEPVNMGWWERFLAWFKNVFS